MDTLALYIIENSMVGSKLLSVGMPISLVLIITIITWLLVFGTILLCIKYVCTCFKRRIRGAVDKTKAISNEARTKIGECKTVLNFKKSKK